MIHGRTYEQGFTGPIDTKVIKNARKHFKGIILANGGINTPEEAKMTLEATKDDGLGLARGLYGRPWLFEQINDHLKTGSYSEPDLKTLKRNILQHAKFASKQKGAYGLVELRKHLAWYVKGLPNAAELRRQLVQVESIKEIEQIIKLK